MSVADSHRIVYVQVALNATGMELYKFHVRETHCPISTAITLEIVVFAISAKVGFSTHF